MENFAIEEEQIELPPGFRFHPTDEELISHYLSPKVFDSNFRAKAIGEVDLNKVEPWELPWKAKMGEKEWYFFCVRDRKYPTGLRTNRATESGYWKATGKDKEIFKAKTLIGMKKTLVFYRGRAPKGEKTNWVMHEYRLEGKFSMNNLPKTAKGEWVISRVFQKNSGGKKIHISGLTRLKSYGDEFGASNLPPLMDVSNFDGHATAANNGETSHVTCFSDSMEDQKQGFNNSLPPPSLSSSKPSFDISSVQNSFFSTQLMPNIENLQFQDPVWMQDQSILRLLIDSNQGNMKAELSQDTDMSSGLTNHEIGQRCYEDEDYQINSAGPVDLDCLWNYSI